MDTRSKELISRQTMDAVWMLDDSTVVGLFGQMLRESDRIGRHRRRARKKGLPCDLSLIQWLQRLRMFDFRCAYCGGNFETLDHIVPIGRKGGTTYQNCVPACADCNSKKGATIWLPATTS